jgi:hypothetical protein
MKTDCFFIAANENQMEFGLKIKSELSGKKWDKAMKNYLPLGMTEVIVVGEGLSLERVALQYKYSYRKRNSIEFPFDLI